MSRVACSLLIFTACAVFLRIPAFLPEVREFITRHTAYNKHDTGWAKGAPSEDHTTPPSLRTCPAAASSPHVSSTSSHVTVTHMSGHHRATVRLAGRKRHVRFESSEALAVESRAAGSGAHSRGAAWMLRQGVACRGAPLSTYRY